MAVSIDWGQKIINVPKADMTLIQPSPEVRELDLDSFRLILKDLEDDLEGMPFPDTHRHNTEVLLAGLTYARTIEIINGYTIEFEDGQYTVNCVGANHNISDVKVANQVSLIINNAAGLISSSAIEYASFSGGVTIDVINGVAGTIGSSTNPIGTPKNPSNNLPDTLQIAANRGFDLIYVNGNLTIPTGTNVENFQIIGQSKTKSTITIESSSLSDGVEVYEAKITGILDGDVRLQYCLLETLTYVNGFILQCGLSDAVITLGGPEDSHFVNCWSEVAGLGTPEINMGGSGRNLSLRGYSGGIKISNLTGSNQASLDFISGQAIIDSTCTDGTIVIRGANYVEDNSGAGCTVVVQSDLDLVLKTIKNKKSLEKTGSVWQLIVYDDDDTTPILTKALKDLDGNNITDIEAGVLAQELASSV